MVDEKAKLAAMAKFTTFLESKKRRKTPERFTILEKIFSISDHFNIESLYLELEKDSYHVSKATVYNTVDLLCECELVRKHQFGNQQVQYEKVASKSSINHHHLICTKCGKIKEVKDPEFVAYLNSKKYNAFTISYFSFNVYGVCNNCLRKIKQNKLEKKNK